MTTARETRDGAVEGRSEGASAPDREILAPFPGLDYLNAVIASRYVILVGTVLAGATALLISLVISPKYEASATLLVAPSKFADTEGQAPAIDVRNYRAFIENQTIATEVVKALKLDMPPHGLTPERFIRRALSVTEVRDSKLLKVGVKLSDPVLAADAANAIATRGVELNRTANQEETVVARDLIKEQLDAARERLTAARAAYEEYQREAQVELLAKDVDTLVIQQFDLRRLLVSIAGERAKLARAEQELARQQRVRDVRRAVGGDIAAKSNEDSPAGERTLPIREALLDPYVNPVYEMLDQQVATTRSKLAQLERERDELRRALKATDGQVPTFSEYYQRRTRLDELKMQQDLAQKLYMDVATSFEQARLQIAGRSAQMQLVDKALPPERPVSPRILINVLAAIVLAPALLVAVLVLREALRKSGVLAKAS